MSRYDAAQHVNVGTGEDITIRDVAQLVRDVVYPGTRLVFDTTGPDGAPRKLLDVSRLHTLGWRHRVALADGIRTTYGWFLSHPSEVRRDPELAAAQQKAPE